MKYYDVTFHELNGESVIKRNVPSEKEGFNIWKDACVSCTDKEIQLVINNGKKVTLYRRYIVRIDVEEVDSPMDKDMRRRDEIMGVVNSLSNMGF